MFLTLYGEKFSFRASVRIIPTHRKYRHKWPVLVRGTAIYAAERTFSAARLSDILRGSYRLSPQSPASSQCCRCLTGIVSPAQAHLSYFMRLQMSSIFSLFFIKFFKEFWCLRRISFVRIRRTIALTSASKAASAAPARFLRSSALR